MPDYVTTHKDDSRVAICFYNENDKPFSIGKKMNEINAYAYMNGYNWDAFFKYYLAQNAPELLEGLVGDPEAGCYIAYYTLSDENEKKAKRFAEMIVSLIENEQELYKIIREHGNGIEWN